MGGSGAGQGPVHRVAQHRHQPYMSGSGMGSDTRAVTPGLNPLIGAQERSQANNLSIPRT